MVTRSFGILFLDERNAIRGDSLEAVLDNGENYHDKDCSQLRLTGRKLHAHRVCSDQAMHGRLKKATSL